jgi:hypothetical protein
MQRTRWLSSLALVIGLAVSVANCGDNAPTGVTAPSTVTTTPNVPAPEAGLVGNLLGTVLKTVGLVQCSPLPRDSVSKTIGRWGGSITVGPQTLYIPAGALDHNVTITAVLSGDSVNAVHFEPQGLQFNRTAYLTLSYANCNLLGDLLGPLFRRGHGSRTPDHIAYTDDSYNIITLLQSTSNPWNQTVTGEVHHFSQYAMAW